MGSDQDAADRLSRAEQAMRAIAVHAYAANQGRATELEDAVMAAMEGRLSETQQVSARRAAHQLAGSAGTFGYPRASQLGHNLEEFFEKSSFDDSGTLLQAVDWLEALNLSLLAPPPDVGSATAVLAQEEGDPLTAAAPPEHRILVLHQVEDQARTIVGAARERGFAANYVSDPTTFEESVLHQPPDVVLLDLALPGRAGFDVLEVAARQLAPIPVIVLSRADAFVDRVEAVRAGARGFLQWDLTPDRLVMAAMDAVFRQRKRRDRLLAVDDDPDVLQLLSLVFDPKTVELSTVSDPLTFWAALRSFEPDLVLLDLDMPSVTGLELCRLIRGDPRWASLPILVLSGSIGPDKVASVFEAGADDYVPKPVVGPELISRVTNRLERVQLYRRMGETDQLTGLANRVRLEGRFSRLIAAAERDDEPLCLALIDLDALRTLNAEQGYAFGDTVLQRMGALLGRTFLGDDLAARWAGQLLAVALYGLNRADGVARIAGVLEDFRAKTFGTPTGPGLHLSFSAAVAQYGLDGDTLDQLVRVAEATVRKAKAGGRDRVVPVGWTSEHDVVDVLVVDDDKELSGLLQHALTTRGLHSEQLGDGAAALARLTGADRLTARVVLLDVDLPGLNGIDVLHQLLVQGVLAHTRVIMLTARAGEAEVLAALAGGAFDHVAKPFSVPILIQRIRRALTAD